MSEKYINAYRLQYWVYAILNKEFGSEVKIHRDSLYSRYEVNRHGFNVTTNTLSLKKVKEYLQKYLSEVHYRSEKSIGYDVFMKTNNKGKVTEELIISIKDSPKELSLHVASYLSKGKA